MQNTKVAIKKLAENGLIDPRHKRGFTRQMGNLLRRGGAHQQRRMFSVIAVSILLSSTLLVGIAFLTPNSSAAVVTHNVADLWIDQLTDFGRIFKGFTWNAQPEDIRDPMTTYGYMGLVMDQDNYIHTPGLENIADCYHPSWPYVQQDDLTVVSGCAMIIDDGTTQQSTAAFKNTGAGTGDPNDILINQSAWTVNNKDWAILQWTLINLKGTTLTNVSLGLELPLSTVLANGGVGGDGGDDIDGYDGANDVYWAQDDSGTTMGYGSAIVSDPITHYFSVDYHDTYTWDQYKMLYQNDSWLYNRLHAQKSVEGAAPGNRSSTVGWDNITLGPGSSRTLTLVVAANNTFANMITAYKDAQFYYNNKLVGFRITEFSDADSGTQKIEVFNDGHESTDLASRGYFLSIDGGLTPLLGNWDKVPLPTFEYGVFTLNPGENIGPEGAAIGLYQDVGGNINQADAVAYGQMGTAPDPLSSESVARRFDTGTFEYTGEWLRNASTGPTWGAQNNVAAANLNPPVVLNEVMFNPGTPELGFIELMYIGGGTLDIQGFRMVCDDEYMIPVSSVLSPSDRYFRFSQSDNPVFFGMMDAAGDNVYLYDNGGALLDMVGWNSAHLISMSTKRVPDGNGTYRGYNDFTSTAAGWVFNTPLNVYMTEISDNDSAVAQIEVYNPLYPPINFTIGFGFGTISGPLNGVWSIPTADPNGHGLFDVTTPNGLNPESDTVSFYQNGILIEEISYGQQGSVPDPLPGESVERIFESGNYTNTWSRNWTLGPTFGFPNDAPALNSSSQVILNEILFNPGMPQHGFVELIYLGGGILDIQGYRIVCDSEYTIPCSYILDTTGKYFILSQPDDPTFFGQMDSPGDNVYLYDSGGSLLDMVGWNSPHTVNRSVARVPEGSGGHLGYDDTTSQLEGWVFDCNPTLPLVRIGPDQFQIGIQGMTMSYSLNVTNLHKFDDVIDISYFSVKGWSVQLLQSDGVTPLIDTETGPDMDGIPDTGIVGPNSTVQIAVNITLPFGIPGGVLEFTTVVANSTVNPFATDNTLINTSTLMGLEYRSPNRYVTFVRGTLMVIGHEDSTQVKITDLSNGNQIAQFAIDRAQTWTTALTDAHVDINATHNLTVLSGNSINNVVDNSWMSYLPTNGGHKSGTQFYGYAPAEMFIFAPCTGTQPPTSITITDESDGDDTQTLTSADVDFMNADVEIYKLTGFDDDVVSIVSNVRISILTGKASAGLDWTATPPSVNGSELGRHFFVFASDSLTLLPLEDNTRIDLIDLSDGDDGRTLMMNRFDIYTQRSLSEFGNPIVARPGVTLYHNSNNLIDDDYLEIIADKDIMVYIGPIADQREEFADLSPSVSTDIFSQEVFTYAQNGGANDLQVFVYDKNHTVVKITSLTYSWGPGSGRDAFYDFTLDSDDFSGVGPWWWEWGGWGGNILHIQSNLPISVFNGDFDGPSFGSFLSVINPPENLKYPDVAISPADISFEPGSVVTEGSIVNINATVHNIGDLNVSDIMVSFNNGDPLLGGTLIGINQTIPYLNVGENQTVNITWIPPLLGLYTIFVAVDFPFPGTIIEIDESNNIAWKVLEVLALLPPQLYITSQNDDIILNWTQIGGTLGLSYYLIYRATSQTDFDFNCAWINTSINNETGETNPIPLRTMWNDTKAALPGNSNYCEEYYYIIRAVNALDKVSRTGRTVGKWTRTFPQGVSAFSLPLEPIVPLYTDYYTTAMSAEYIKYIDPATRTWVQHYYMDGNTNNAEMKQGEGYEVKVTTSINYSFTGLPGAMIIFDDDTGFSGFDFSLEAKSLSVSIQPGGDVDLAWQEPASMGLGDSYEVYYSDTRDGFFGNLGMDYFMIGNVLFGTSSISHPNAQADTPGSRLHYMVVPLKASGVKGSGTYSIGIWTEEILSGYDSFGIPLKMNSTYTADRFCDNINSTVGINYFIYSQQRWGWHSTRMPEWAFDPILVMTGGYQISTSAATKFTFIGI